MLQPMRSGSPSGGTSTDEHTIDHGKRVRRIQWLRQHGTREDILTELEAFSGHIDDLCNEIRATSHSAEETYSRSMTAGRRSCMSCPKCKKYIPGSCGHCGCAPLLHDKLTWEQHQKEMEIWQTEARAKLARDFDERARAREQEWNAFQGEAQAEESAAAEPEKTPLPAAPGSPRSPIRPPPASPTRKK